MKIKKNCKICKTEIEDYPSQFLNGYGQFCSRKCANEAKKYLEYKHGKDHYNWKGGRRINHDGYVLIYKPSHPFSESMGYIMEHRLIMEEKLGRYLTKEEVVDHINGIKNDNRIENLRLFDTHGEHIKEEYKRGRYVENIKRMSEKMKGEGNPMYGRIPWNKGLKFNQI